MTEKLPIPDYMLQNHVVEVQPGEPITKKSTKPENVFVPRPTLNVRRYQTTYILGGLFIFLFIILTIFGVVQLARGGGENMSLFIVLLMLFSYGILAACWSSRTYIIRRMVA